MQINGVVLLVLGSSLATANSLHQLFSWCICWTWTHLDASPPVILLYISFYAKKKSHSISRHQGPTQQHWHLQPSWNGALHAWRHPPPKLPTGNGIFLMEKRAFLVNLSGHPFSSLDRCLMFPPWESRKGYGPFCLPPTHSHKHTHQPTDSPSRSRTHIWYRDALHKCHVATAVIGV